MGNIYMEADQVRFKNSTYHNLQTAVAAALEGGGGGGTTVVANPEGSATADLSKLQVGESVYGVPATAAKIAYDNTSSRLTADDVQDAIDELNAAIPGVATTSAPGIVQPDGTTVMINNGVISAVGGSSAPLNVTYFKEQGATDYATGNVVYVENGRYRRLYAHDTKPAIIKQALDAITISSIPGGAVGFAKVNIGNSRYYGFVSVYYPGGVTTPKFEIGYYAGNGYPMSSWTDIDFSSTTVSAITFDLLWYSES